MGAFILSCATFIFEDKFTAFQCHDYVLWKSNWSYKSGCWSILARLKRWCDSTMVNLGDFVMLCDHLHAAACKLSSSHENIFALAFTHSNGSDCRRFETTMVFYSKLHLVDKKTVLHT